MSTPDDPSFEDEVHRGHDLETGLLQRVRQWTDLFPWLRLSSTMRLAASPPHLAIVAIAGVVWAAGMTLIASDTPLNQFVVTASIGQFLVAALWSGLLLVPLAIALTRQGGLLTAGRSLMSMPALVRFALRRSVAGWIALVVPLACVVVLALPLVVLGWISGLVEDWWIAELVLAAFAALLAIPSGLLGFGAVVAVPLSWAAIGNEENPDPLDALSRGYEALFRRPLRLVLYALVAAVILAVLWTLASGVAEASQLVAKSVLFVTGGSTAVEVWTLLFLQQIPLLAGFTALWNLVGGAYLLVRYDTGGQEVEDLWVPAVAVESPLPELPLSD